LDPDSVTDRSSGVSVPDELRLDSDTRDADVEDGSSRSRSLLRLRLPLRRGGGDGPSSSPETAAPPLTQQSSDLHGCVVADIAWYADRQLQEPPTGGKCALIACLLCLRLWRDRCRRRELAGDEREGKD